MAKFSFLRSGTFPGAGVLVLAAVACATTATTHSQDGASPSLPSDEASCDQWMAFSDGERLYAMQQFITTFLPAAVPSATRKCLASIDYQIADHATEICGQDGGLFAPAAATAIETAIEYCQMR